MIVIKLIIGALILSTIISYLAEKSGQGKISLLDDECALELEEDKNGKRT